MSQESNSVWKSRNGTSVVVVMGTYISYHYVGSDTVYQASEEDFNRKYSRQLPEAEVTRETLASMIDRVNNGS